MGSNSRRFELWKLTTFPCVALLLLVIALPASGSDLRGERETLEGLKSVVVRVEEFSEKARRAGFSETSLQTDVELKLRMAGINVSSKENVGETTGVLHVVVNAAFHDTPGKPHCFSTSIELMQWVELMREPSIFNLTPTWWVGGLGLGTVPAVREKLKDFVDQFINAWLSVNPKPEPTP